jgi:hypothetical protein
MVGKSEFLQCCAADVTVFPHDAPHVVSDDSGSLQFTDRLHFAEFFWCQMFVVPQLITGVHRPVFLHVLWFYEVYLDFAALKRPNGFHVYCRRQNSIDLDFDALHINTEKA